MNGWFASVVRKSAVSTSRARQTSVLYFCDGGPSPNRQTTHKIIEGERSMKVTVPQLRAMSDKIWNHLEASGYEEIELQHDFYWHIPAASAYDMANEPSQHDVSRLADDSEFLQRLLEKDPGPIAYDLVGLSALLRAIGEQIVS
jgi:LPS sulfotransferase NodH